MGKSARFSLSGHIGSAIFCNYSFCRENKGNNYIIMLVAYYDTAGIRQFWRLKICSILKPSFHKRLAIMPRKKISIQLYYDNVQQPPEKFSCQENLRPNIAFTIIQNSSRRQCVDNLKERLKGRIWEVIGPIYIDKNWRKASEPQLIIKGWFLRER